MQRTKMVFTIGPASENKEYLRELILAGMSAARLNFSHGDFEEHGARIKTIRELRKELNKQVAIVLDTKGPEIRTKEFDGKVQLVKGSKFTVYCTEDVMGDAKIGRAHV